MDGYIDDYIKAIRRNEVRDFFFGKGEYYFYNDSDGKRLHRLSFENCIGILGEQNLYNRLSSDYIDVLKDNDVTLQEFYDLIKFVVLYYREAVFSYKPDRYHFEWVYPEELTRLFNVNYERLKHEGDTKEIEEFLHELKEYYNVDLLNYDRVNVIGSKTVLPRVPRTTEGEFVVPDGIVRIPNYAFAECDKITSVVMPDTVESIGTYAFTGCTSLKKVKVSENLTFVGRPAFGVGSSIGRDDVPACSIESIYIPRKVNRIIDFDTFSKCKSLKSIEVDSENPYYASYDGILYTKDMKSLIICPCGRTSKVVRIPESVEYLGCLAFCDCSGIDELYIPASVKKMDWYAPLEGCSGLKRIHIGVKENIEKVFNEFDFEDVHKGCVLYVPKGTKKIYKKVLSKTKDVKIVEEKIYSDMKYKPLSSTTLKFAFTAMLLAVLFVLNLFVGSVDIPFNDVVNILLTGQCDNEAFTFIVLHSRMPQAVTALLCGGSLAVAGLMLQTTFHNHLADPSILGISSGASLGVAVVLLCFGGTTLALVGKGWVVIIVAALLGSMLVLGILLMLATFITNELLLLIVGIVISFLTSSCITLLNYFANEQGVHSYILWGMGSFGSVTTEQLPIFVVFTVVGWILSVALVKPLNALLLGNNYARNLGVNIKLTYQLLLVATGLLTAVTTAFCGPISFIGLAVPHLARIALRSSHHNTLLPFTLLCGSMVALLCNFLCVLPGKGTTLPVNAVTPIIGVPVILYVIFSGYRNRISLSFGRRISRSSEAANRDGILSAENLTIGYGKKVVASNINLRFEKGELVCLLGRNGAGKSTLLRTLSGFLKPIKDSVFLKETDINKLSFRQISKFIGVVLTDKVQVDNITVEQVVSFGRQPHTGYFGRLSNRDKEIIVEMIAKVGLAHKQHSYFSNLSDGERQKTMIAKALTQECEVLILDEPTAFLDEQSQLDIMLLLKQIAHNEHKLVILSTHQSALANEHADRIVRI